MATVKQCHRFNEPRDRGFCPKILDLDYRAIYWRSRYIDHISAFKLKLKPKFSTKISTKIQFWNGDKTLSFKHWSTLVPWQNPASVSNPKFWSGPSIEEAKRKSLGFSCESAVHLIKHKSKGCETWDASTSSYVQTLVSALRRSAHQIREPLPSSYSTRSLLSVVS